MNPVAPGPAAVHQEFMRRAWHRFIQYRRTRRWVRFAEDGFVVLTLFAAVLAWQTRDLVPGGAPAPPFELTDLEGRTWKLSQLAGEKVILHFWAPWCGVCEAEAGTLDGLHRSLGEDGAKVVSVALAFEDPAQVRRFVEAHKVTYPVLLGTEALQREYRIEAFPTTYVLSEDGRIEDAAVGYTTSLGLRLRLWL